MVGHCITYNLNLHGSIISFNAETSTKSQLNPHFNPKLWVESLVCIVFCIVQVPLTPNLTPMNAPIKNSTFSVPRSLGFRTLMQWPLNFLQLGGDVFSEL